MINLLNLRGSVEGTAMPSLERYFHDLAFLLQALHSFHKVAYFKNPY